MQQTSRLMLAAAALALASTAVASAQSSPMPSSTAMPMSSPAPAMSSLPVSPPTGNPTMGPSATANPVSAPSTSAPASSGSGTTRSTGGTPSANGGGKLKQIKSGSLSRSQVVYGLTHQVQAAKQLLKMKTVNFDNLRVYKVPTTLKSMLKVSDADQQAIALAILGNGIQVAQTTPALPGSNGNNSPIQYLRDVLANINVSNALNNLNVLNGSNVNVNVALSNVLNNNKISIGQVVGLYIGGGGIITTITK
ncbi:MAG TPA: hypothetical protein VIW69_10170 [Candidatus Elarobacter sp.]